jgi:hypothetical protein
MCARVNGTARDKAVDDFGKVENANLSKEFLGRKNECMYYPRQFLPGELVGLK